MDLNADLGEGFGVWRLGDDDGLLDVVTSANVACGFHAGDPATMRRVCARAAERGVAVGAQVSYRDLAGFGRRRIEYDPDELRDEVIYQLVALDGMARVAGTRVRYVKPHGALYNSVVWDTAQAQAVVAAVAEVSIELAVLGLPGSALLRVASDAGLNAVAEGFADRGYLRDGTLVPRSQPAALITRPDDVVAQAVRMATSGEVEAVDGSLVETVVSSICVHGDTPGAAALAHAIRQALAQAGVPVAPFTRPNPPSPPGPPTPS
jgi:5-oxoprolinase (ATP-hydrolysing) subunit A